MRNPRDLRTIETGGWFKGGNSLNETSVVKRQVEIEALHKEGEHVSQVEARFAA
jgi:hypothetical protein